MKKIILVDGNSLMFRSYYATAYTGNLMQNKKGIYTNAIFGFVNMMNSILEEEKTNLFVAFDAGSKTFRHQQFESYKGTRKALPDELLMQIPYIKEYLDILNVKRLELFEYEADDLIASMAILAQNEGFDEIKIITGDKDLLQLVGGNIKVCITRKGVKELEEFNESNFFEKMGFYPNQVPDYKGLVGDTSDNLPGIKGIGEKTAVKLLTEYQTLENIINNADLIKGKMSETIKNGKDSGIECKRLATLEKNVNFDFSIDDTLVKEYDINKLSMFYTDLEFESFLNRLNVEKKEQIQSSRKSQEKLDYIVINDNSYVFNSNSSSYINIEIFGSNYLKSEILGLAIYNDKKNYFVTLNGLLTNTSIRNYLNGNIAKKTFDIKKLYVALKINGIEINNVDFDLLLGSYILSPEYANEDFSKVASNFNNFDVVSDDVIYGQNLKAIVPQDYVYQTNAIKKCHVIEILEKEILDKIINNYQFKLFDMELKLSKVLGDMEINGLKINTNRLKKLGEEFLVIQENYMNKIYELAGITFNINSPKQIAEVLFEKLGLPSGKKNKTGFSTNSEVLEKLAKEYEIARVILDYRGVTKLISTYINGLFEVIDNEEFIHPLYKQALTVTGRLSSTEPNIQNMPIRTEIGQSIREIFVSRFPGGKIMSSDYSQIELRVLAHIANDENMINMFKNNTDFHRQTASQMYEVSLEDVTKEQRRAAKAINFGIIYGMSAWGLSESINITPLEANLYINKYFDTFKEVKKYLDNTINDAKKNGYTKTIFNRIRYIKEINDSNKSLVAFGERTAMNSPIQGSAADIIKFAMIAVSERIKNMKSYMIAQVHDELVFDVHPDEVEQMEKIVKDSMEEVISLKVPLIAEVKSGENWLKS